MTCTNTPLSAEAFCFNCDMDKSSYTNQECPADRFRSEVRGYSWVVSEATALAELAELTELVHCGSGLRPLLTGGSNDKRGTR